MHATRDHQQNSLPPYPPARSSLTAADATTPTAPRPVEPTALQTTLLAASSARSIRGTDDEFVSLLGVLAACLEAWSAGAVVDVTPCKRALGMQGAGAFMWWAVPSCAGGRRSDGQPRRGQRLFRYARISGNMIHAYFPSNNIDGLSHTTAKTPARSCNTLIFLFF